MNLPNLLTDFVNEKSSTAALKLYYRLNRLTLQNFQSETSLSNTISVQEVIHGIFTQNDDPFSLAASVLGLCEKWYRQGIINGVKLDDAELDPMFHDRNRQLLNFFEQWLTEMCDNMTV